MKKELTIPALALSLFSVAPVSANTVKSSSDTSAPFTSAPWTEDNVKVSNLGIKNSSNKTTQKDVKPNDLKINLISKNKDQTSSELTPCYFVGVPYKSDTMDVPYYYAFIIDGHPVVFANQYVIHHHKKCILMLYRGKKYYVPLNLNKQQTLSLENVSNSVVSIDFKSVDHEKEVMQQIEKSKQTYEQYQKVKKQNKANRDKLAAQNYYDLGKYLNQHPDQIVKSINVIIPANQNVPDGFTNIMSYNQTLYLVGTQAQLDQAFNDIRNYQPNNRINILTNNSQVAIFDSAYHQITNPSDLYTTGEKIQLNNQVIDRNTLENQMVRDYQTRPEVHHAD